MKHEGPDIKAVRVSSQKSEKRVLIHSQQKRHKKAAMFVLWNVPLASQSEASFWAEEHWTEKGTRHPL